MIGILYDSGNRNTKPQAPAFAEAASRRQAKSQIISNVQMANVQNKRSF
jgi:hypothetical protein